MCDGLAALLTGLCPESAGIDRRFRAVLWAIACVLRAAAVSGHEVSTSTHVTSLSTGSDTPCLVPCGSPDWLVERPAAEWIEGGLASKRTTDTATSIRATGRGVIVGFLDSGIDWRHLDFRRGDDTLRTRILSIWDTGSEVGPPRMASAMVPSGHVSR